ncbi:hypothetical protein BHE74_00028821 [Ensete ventricosum]|nr:hypothetical protein BHE74_00028821 [Ensete ventricosum]
MLEKHSSAGGKVQACQCRRRAVAFFSSPKALFLVLWTLVFASVFWWRTSYVDEVGFSLQLPRVRTGPMFRPVAFILTDFGAVGDGETLNTDAFESAVAEIAKLGDAGGGQLDVPAGLWLTAPFNLTSHMTLFLAEGAVILGVESDSWSKSEGCGYNSAGVSIGSEMSGGVSNVTVDNLHVWESKRGVRIKTAAGRGGYIRNISYRNVTLNHVSIGIVIKTDYNEHADEFFDPKAIPILESIHFSGIHGQNVDVPVQLNGSQEIPVRDVSFRDMSIGLSYKKKKKNIFRCSFVQGRIIGTIFPMPCLNLDIFDGRGRLVKRSAARAPLRSTAVARVLHGGLAGVEAPNVTPSMLKSVPRVGSIQMEWRRGTTRHSSLMSLGVASAVMAAKSPLFHLGLDCPSWVASWISMPPWTADLAWVSVS